MNRNSSKAITRRDFIKTTSTLAAAGTVLGSVPGLTRHVYAATKIRIGVIAPSHCALPMVYAFLSNNFRKNGINAEIVYLPDMPDIAKGMLSGDLQVGQLISPVFYAINAGAGPFRGNPTPMVCAQTAGTNGGVLVRAKGSDISMPQDLKGKNVGVHSPLMTHSLLFNTLLTRYDLDPRKDINIRVIQMSELIPALKKGEIDAFINPEPLATLAEVKGAGEEMMLSKNLWFKHPCCLVTMRKDFYDDNRDLAKAVYASTMESGLFLNNAETREEAIGKVHSESGPYGKVPLPGLKKAFQPGRTDFDPFMYQSSGKAVLTMMRKFNILPDSVDIDKMVAEACLSDLSREMLVSVGGSAPAENSRPEKIVGRVVVS
jgi:nitrate/nitrite transport system substrate-binding protein